MYCLLHTSLIRSMLNRVDSMLEDPYPHYVVDTWDNAFKKLTSSLSRTDNCDKTQLFSMSQLLIPVFLIHLI